MAEETGRPRFYYWTKLIALRERADAAGFTVTSAYSPCSISPSIRTDMSIVKTRSYPQNLYRIAPRTEGAALWLDLNAPEED